METFINNNNISYPYKLNFQFIKYTVIDQGHKVAILARYSMRDAKITIDSIFAETTGAIYPA